MIAAESAYCSCGKACGSIVYMYRPSSHFNSVLKVVKGGSKQQLIFDDPIEALADRKVISAKGRVWKTGIGFVFYVGVCVEKERYGMVYQN